MGGRINIRGGRKTKQKLTQKKKENFPIPPIQILAPTAASGPILELRGRLRVRLVQLGSGATPSLPRLNPLAQTAAPGPILE